ncbi:MAG TPA: polyprenyl diphosphate synthase [Devosia sp.]|jgi:undecaprenyl diphosphate synthase|uniref:polyprenyl diphosphate synthase n=1 Tax=Devosia sp. TaxID=1871048 RepID=UPI002DDCCDED|nr:polyprenyl diphosphate synthase [Devosia sp.]HEV2514588.1 polyprenyl diphosphate synthase [Devosia sp.]
MQTTPNHKLHVAIIMDGNGRWAEARGLPRPAGHQVGADTVRAIVRSAIARDIGALSLYAFSTYNWRRSEAEVAGMMALLRHFLLVEARQLRDANVRISILGRRDRLPLGLVKAIAAAERSTAACTGLHLRVAIDYSARDAILAAAAAGPEAIAAELGTEDVDFLIRTGGDQRLSDFMLWECAQAELYFTRVKWPDFGPAEFDAALAEYGTRVRSFGGVAEPVRAMAS